MSDSGSENYNTNMKLSTAANHFKGCPYPALIAFLYWHLFWVLTKWRQSSSHLYTESTFEVGSLSKLISRYCSRQTDYTSAETVRYIFHFSKHENWGVTCNPSESAFIFPIWLLLISAYSPLPINRCVKDQVWPKALWNQMNWHLISSCVTHTK